MSANKILTQHQQKSNSGNPPESKLGAFPKSKSTKCGFVAPAYRAGNDVVFQNFECVDVLIVSVFVQIRLPKYAEME